MTKKSSKARPLSKSALRPSESFAGLPSAKYLFFGGKGGVGKTTAAAGTALLLLEDSQPGEQILLFSTDPAHSLSDSLGREVGDRFLEVAREGTARLIAREMDAVSALDQFRSRHRETITKIAERGTFLDENDIRELLDLSLPGMDEVMALFELGEIHRSGLYARVVVDTAPSGHTSRLLRLPEFFQHWLGMLDRLTEKHRFIVARLTRRRQVDDVELFLKEFSEKIQGVRDLLYGDGRSAFILVTIPEAMVIEETRRYFNLLRNEKVAVTSLIINRVERERGACRYCRARASGQRAGVKWIEQEFAGLRLHKVPLLPVEVRGVEALKSFARAAWKGAHGEQTSLKKPDGSDGPGERRIANPSRGATSAGGVLPTEERRLLLFGGKGGVGKTTTAAAAALAMAESDPQARVLIFSTDPAHSLSDSFNEQIGELRKGVAGVANLDAMEIDPVARFEAVKKRCAEWSDELLGSFTAGSQWQIEFDRESTQELIEYAPPGIDEIMVLSAIGALLDEGRYTAIVLDTAPTGHLIRLLELPEVALSWIRAIIKLLLKYKDVVRGGVLAEELVGLSKSVKRVAGLLTDPARCEFIGVAVPERMSFEETVRLTGSLDHLNVRVGRLIINKTIPAEAGGCSFCASRRRLQNRVINSFREEFKEGPRMALAPQQPREIRGPEALRRHFLSWQPLARRSKSKAR